MNPPGSLTCSKVDWEKLYSSKLKLCLAEDRQTMEVSGAA